ncbi:trypsin-like cysteine/serine peptidase domain-containing protein [Hypoxylon fuscum]|nr:trypsin-like cysteine/serine peptidase domain-containing protein [Hypoxylon fuscum]
MTSTDLQPVPKVEHNDYATVAYPHDERTEFDIRDGLCTQNVQTSWPSVPEWFRRYQLLLQYLFHRNKLHVEMHDIEEMIDQMASHTFGRVAVNQEGVSTIFSWRRPFRQRRAFSLKAGNLVSRMQRSSKALPILLDRSVQTFSIVAQHDSKVLSNIAERFSTHVRNLELRVVGRIVGGVNIINPLSTKSDMVGWQLSSVPVIGEHTRRDLHREEAAAKEAILYGMGSEQKDVSLADISSRGKFLGIARLRGRFDRHIPGSENDVYLGTGWLVDDKTIATAGHIAYDETFGRLRSVEAVFGTDLAKRHGIHVVVHWGWYSGFMRKSDLAFIRLNERVECKELSYIPTPIRHAEGERLILRGYSNNPGYNDTMRVSECEAKYDIQETNGVLEYELNTKGGSSGSPVFNSTGKVIGIHSGYGIARGSHRKGQTINVGVIINDRDNNINAFRAVLRFMAGEGMRGVLVRQMGHNTTRYTVMEV